METLFLENVYMNHNPPTHIIIRSPSLRPELAHHVVEIPSATPRRVSCLDITVNLTKSLQQHLRPHERILIFAQSTDDVVALSGRLKSSKYYSALGENEASGSHTKGIDERTINHTRWTEGQSLVMASTPALIQGIDHPDVRFIIFHGGAYGLISYYQGAGRGGRRGDRCDVFTVRDKRLKSKPKEDSEDVGAFAEWKEFETTTQCRLSVITSCFDGSDLNCSKIPNQQFCDNCHPEDEFHVLALTEIESCLPVAPGGQNPQGKLNKRTASPASSDDRLPISIKRPRLDLLPSSGSLHPSPIKRPRLDLPPSSGSLHSPPIKRKMLDQPPSSSTSSSSGFKPSPQYINKLMARLRSSPSPANSSPVNSYSSPVNSSPVSSSPVNSSPVYSYFSPVNSSPGSPGISGTTRGQRRIGGSILRGALENSRSDEQKRKKSAQLNNIMPMLREICPVCFVLKGQRVKSLSVGNLEGSGHRPLIDCGLQGKFKDFVDFRKGIILGGPYLYCFPCGMPQSKNGNDLEPKCHSELQVWTKKIPCPWKEKIHAFLFALYYDKAAMKDVLTHFMYTDKEDCGEMALDEWAKWLCTDLTDQGEYWKGLEVFLFKMAERGLKGE
jgi:Helicase conserved C-terminal domain